MAISIKRKKSTDQTDSGDKNGLVTSDWSRIAGLFGPMRLSGEQLRNFASHPGSDTEPWDVLLSMLATDEHTALKLLADRTGLEFISEPRIEESSARFYELVPSAVARRDHVAATCFDGAVMTVATAQPMQPATFSMIEQALGLPIRLVLCPRGSVANLINRGYEQQQDLVTEIIEEMPLDESAMQTAAGSIGESNDLLQLANQGPVIRLVNMILFEALRRRSSDVHIHPMENRLVIRLRVDGMLVDAFSPPQALAPAISSRLKVMTELDIANRHSPQDGHTSVRIGSKKIDIRMSCIPTVYGERIVLRLLDQSQTKLSLNEVGMTEQMQEDLLGLIDQPNGMLLVTGPTGSGKTTTLYAALGCVDRGSRNVMTVEDPVEYHMDGISQMQVNTKRGVTFATGLRALLRQDPDVILVGEIRDEETAKLAIQASLTGHFVLATLHTNDAPGAIPRLMDIGVEPFLITSSLVGVLAQRLLRRICTDCSGAGLVQGQKCENCFGTGFRGRMAVYEMVTMNDELRRKTAERADGVTLYETAIRHGFVPMKEDARRKILSSQTTAEEVQRVLGE